MVPLRAVPNRYNLHYLRTKHLKMEHDLGLGLDEDEDEGQATSEGLTDSEERNSTTSDATSKGEEGDALVMEAEAEAEGPPHVEYAFGRETVVAAVQAIKEVRGVREAGGRAAWVWSGIVCNPDGCTSCFAGEHCTGGGR